ncbi:MAG: hypothetical protein LCH32_12595 [Bacteroidetes bacterium]|nr:hypothetical protein [Bacteroidota bacterium]
MFVGDLSLGLEYCFKSFRQEVSIFYKIYDVEPYYSFNNGYRINYNLGYNFINKDKLLLGANLIFSNQKKYFENKNKVPYFIDNESSNTFDKSIYNVSYKDKYTGVGIGLNGIMKIYKSFCLGMSLNVLYLEGNSSKNINYHVQGPIATDPNDPLFLPLVTPYSITQKTKKIQPNILIKIAYEI